MTVKDIESLRDMLLAQPPNSEATDKVYKKKMEFAQQVCVFGMVLVTVMLLANFVLALLDKPPLTENVNLLISVFGTFATGGYFTLQGVRNCSLNKHHMRIPDDGSGKYILPDPNSEPQIPE